MNTTHFPAPLLRARARLPAVLLAAALALLYLATLQRDINGSNDEYVNDTAEFQNVLTQWGTAHPTGYPLYSLLGAAFTSAGRLVGAPPAAAASAFSTLWALVALLGVYLLLQRLGVRPWLAAATALLMAALRPVWIHAVVAEVYALLVALLVLAFLAASQWWRSGQPRWLYPLAFVMGLAVGHHRLAVLAAPALAVYVAPLALSALRARPARLVWAALAFALPFAVYLYLPWRAWSGATWLYGQPGTWDGFWAIVTAREYQPLLAESGARRPAGLDIARATLDTLGWPLALVGMVGLLGRVWGDRWHDRGERFWAALAWLTLLGANLVFVAVYTRAVFLPAALLPALVALVMGVGLAAEGLAERGRVGLGLAGAGLVAASVALVTQNGLWVRSITADPYSRQRIEAVAHSGLQPPDPILMTTWGRDLFAVGYGEATGALPPLTLVDHRADLKALLASGRPLYVISPTFYTLPLKWWNERLGRAYLSGYSDELVRVSDQPVLDDADVPPGQTPIAMGPISLLAWQVTPRDDGRSWRLTLYWQAQERPRRDYSVFVHLSDRDRIDGPDAIIAQADRVAPVYGWYPTSRWRSKEIVRDDYAIPVPDGKTARLVSVGLYAQDDAGQFQNLGQLDIPLAHP